MAASYTERPTGKWHALLEEVSTELGTQRRRNSIGKFELKLIEAIDEVEALLDDRKIRKSNCEEKLAKLEASCSECREAYRAARSDAEGPRAPCVGTTPGQASGRVAGCQIACRPWGPLPRIELQRRERELGGQTGEAGAAVGGISHIPAGSRSSLDLGRRALLQKNFISCTLTLPPPTASRSGDGFCDGISPWCDHKREGPSRNPSER